MHHYTIVSLPCFHINFSSSLFNKGILHNLVICTDDERTHSLVVRIRKKHCAVFASPISAPSRGPRNRNPAWKASVPFELRFDDIFQHSDDGFQQEEKSFPVVAAAALNNTVLLLLFTNFSCLATFTPHRSLFTTQNYWHGHWLADSFRSPMSDLTAWLCLYFLGNRITAMNNTPPSNFKLGNATQQ